MKDGCEVKICGITNIEDALSAAREGADYLGVVVEVSYSPRSLTVEGAREIFSRTPLPAVALVYQMSPERIKYLVNSLHPHALQFLNLAPETITWCKKEFTELECWQSLHLPPAGEGLDRENVLAQIKAGCEAGADVIVLDTAAVVGGTQRYGGTGRTSDWQLVRELGVACTVPLFLAGGINPANVQAAIKVVNPEGIDLCSGVEAQPGKKSPDKIRALMQAVRETIREATSERNG
ncbi:phosphoribosylanthranilate isomerase [Desulfoscipio gibsoniae]|uniref:N-(5'-phosphoribosyl)anthranilate isomerase n=1 Tax=Desulfoscipio gibsoniae DSM 7213 TaxID=767817 RepID=R4KUT7_9FIRM|nr:phosphoribosylanthranilate isomerase [Desulfoscipio gibsoniae]AGL03386.1 phosphoribosylanthranilate isomerase [Desulfoscipio gibsoniae DSM 7213]